MDEMFILFFLRENVGIILKINEMKWRMKVCIILKINEMKF